MFHFCGHPGSEALLSLHFSYHCGDNALFFETLVLLCFLELFIFFAHPSSAGTGSSRPVTRLWMSRYRKWMDGSWTMDWCVPAPPTEGRIVLNQGNQRLSQQDRSHGQFSPIQGQTVFASVDGQDGGSSSLLPGGACGPLCPTSQQGFDRTRTLKTLQDSITEKVQTCEISFSQLPPCLFIP